MDSCLTVSYISHICQSGASSSFLTCSQSSDLWMLLEDGGLISWWLVNTKLPDYSPCLLVFVVWGFYVFLFVCFFFVPARSGWQWQLQVERGSHQEMTRCRPVIPVPTCGALTNRTAYICTKLSRYPIDLLSGCRLSGWASQDLTFISPHDGRRAKSWWEVYG